MDARLGIDTVVLLAYFIGIVVLGLWAGRRNRNLEDFSLGSRSIPWWAVLASIIAAETSAGGPVNMELMELLLQHGANVNDQVTGTRTYSMRVSRAPSANEGRTALHIAAQEGKTDVVRYLLAKGAKPEFGVRLFPGGGALEKWQEIDAVDGAIGGNGGAGEGAGGGEEIEIAG